MILMSLCLDMAAESISDMGRAREWCDGAMLRRVEGIWEFPDDETRVLIRRENGTSNRYEIILVESADTRLQPGEKIGWLQASPIPTKFEMELYRNRKGNILSDPGHCMAELNETDDALLVSGRKFKFSLASRWFLPSFWRALRVSSSNPLDKLPHGMVRIYPTTRKQQPDYL